jgi:hypothetical protein
MNTTEKAALLLEEFASSRNIAELAFGEDGDCALVDEHERVTHLQIDSDNGRLLCLAALGGLPSPAACPPEILYDLLAENFCWGGSCGATLAIEAQSGQVILQRYLPVEDADAGAFSRFLDTFTRLVEYWEERFAQIRAAHAEEGSPFSIAEEETEKETTETMIRI